MVTERKQVTFQERLGQALVEAGFLTSKDLDGAREIAKKEGKRLTDVLIERHLISRDVLNTALSFQFKVPVVNLKQIEIKPDVLKLIPEEFAREHEVIPIGLGPGGELQVAMENPNDFGLINTLAAMTTRTIRPALSIDTKVMNMIDVIYKPAAQIGQQLTETLRPVTEQTAITARAAAPLVVEGVAEAPVVRAVEMITLQAVKSRASDIHIMPTVDSSKVLYRIDSVLHNVHTIPLGIHESMVSRIKVMANMDITERRRPQDGSFSMKF